LVCGNIGKAGFFQIFFKKLARYPKNTNFIPKAKNQMGLAAQLTDKIIEGELEEALDMAIEFLSERDTELYRECIQHKGRLNDHTKRFRVRTINLDTLDMTRAQVQSALLEVVVKRIKLLSDPNYAPPTVPPTPPPSNQQTVTLNFASTNHQPAAGYSAPNAVPSLADHAAARQLVEDFVKLLATYEVENAAWRAAPFLHRSLLQGEMMQPQFKQNNFYSAHQRFRSYKMPVSFAKAQSTNRTAIGSLRDRDEGEEFVYTLEKTVENGGMPGTVRVFFPKITLVSF
jgi:Effector-associated domain 11